MSNLIKIEGTAEIVCLVLNRPKNVNALNAALLSALKTALDQAIAANARAIVITGAGRGFSGGADFSEMNGTIDDLAVDARIAAVTDTLVNAPIPIVAALHGFCFGGAVDVAWACDLVVATPTTRLAVPATRLGILYNPRSLRRLYARFGSLALRRLLLLGDEMNGREAWQMGAIAHLAEDGDVLTLANKVASKAVHGQYAAIDATKQFLNELDNGGVDLEHWQSRRNSLQAAVERQPLIQARQKR
ncbi:MAG: enoyl-CoA hydratase/isomerase family protein [Candidatus Promineifilaceae bacterium]